MKVAIIIVLIFSIILGILFYFFNPFRKQTVQTPKPVTLTVWGLWEDQSLIKPAIEGYTRTHPNVTINYNFQSSLNYRSRVQTQIANGQGPDILMVHDTWVPSFVKSGTISPSPQDIVSSGDLADFYPVVKDTLSQNNQIFALPRGIDGLALYYNEDVLKAAGVTVPQTWEQFISAATKMTVVDQNGTIKTAGAALGATGNVDHWPDILGLLFLQQPGADLKNPATEAGVEVLKFYTGFAKDPQKRTWDKSMESSTQAFKEGKLGFYFAPSWRAHELRVANPQLNFKTAPVPQLPGSNVGWATFWAYAVSSKSQNLREAWDFVKFLTSADTQKQLYQQASQVRLFGLPYSRASLKGELANDPVAGAFVNQAPSYKSWYLSSSTADQGVNDEMIKYFEDAVNATVAGQDPAQALQTSAKGVAQVLDKYNNPNPAPSGQ